MCTRVLEALFAKVVVNCVSKDTEVFIFSGVSDKKIVWGISIIHQGVCQFLSSLASRGMGGFPKKSKKCSDPTFVPWEAGFFLRDF